MPIIPDTWEVEVGGSWSEASLSKSMRLYLKNKPKVKRAKDDHQVVECLASVRP
jgi:hypothetical protein